MSRIIPVQVCRSLDGWLPVEIDSASDPDLTYVILVNPWGTAAESICECKSYEYRGRCKHQALALMRVCGWTELLSDQKQTREERKGKICPRCEGHTTWTMEVVEDDEECT